MSRTRAVRIYREAALHSVCAIEFAEAEEKGEVTSDGSMMPVWGWQRGQAGQMERRSRRKVWVHGVWTGFGKPGIPSAEFQNLS